MQSESWTVSLTTVDGGQGFFGFRTVQNVSAERVPVVVMRSFRLVLQQISVILRGLRAILGRDALAEASRPPGSPSPEGAAAQTLDRGLFLSPVQYDTDFSEFFPMSTPHPCLRRGCQCRHRLFRN